MHSFSFGFGGRRGHQEKRHSLVTPLDISVIQIQMSLVLVIFIGPMDAVNVEDMESFESIFIGLSTLQSATNNFDEKNKVGEGGFGVVYKVCRHSFAKL